MINWDQIDTVLLDMDGTLLDLYFDNHFWLEYLPYHYAKQNGLNPSEAYNKLITMFAEHKNTLNWYCLDFWSKQLNIDIVALKHDVKHLISPRPGAIEFVKAVNQSGRQAVLVTNAHRSSLELKIKQTGINKHLYNMVSSHDFGLPKEDTDFWDLLAKSIPYNKPRTLLIDDSIPVLRSARAAGIGQWLAIAKPDSKKPDINTEEFLAIGCFSHIMPPSK